ncbi:MAG: hypothetical protein OXI38_07185 [Bacteroidota bacterium]|nr:hypothetical protein [Bacteroidota bacterium]
MMSSPHPKSYYRNNPIMGWTDNCTGAGAEGNEDQSDKRAGDHATADKKYAELRPENEVRVHAYVRTCSHRAANPAGRIR